MSWKRTPLLGSGLIALILITACLSRTSESLPGQATATPIPPPFQTAPPASKEITIWHGWDGLYIETILERIKIFEAEHPGLTVELVSPGELEEDLDALITAGDGPDILSGANESIGIHANDRTIVDLESLGIDKAFLESTYEPAAVEGVVWRNKIWALPESMTGIALVYNKALLTSEYLPADPLDFDRLLENAQAFTAAYPGKYLICSPGLGGRDAYYAAPIYFGFGVPKFIDDQGQVHIDSPEAIRAGDFIAELSNAAPEEASEEICASLFAEGGAAARWTGPWAIQSIEDSGIDFGILPLGRPYVDIQVLMITQNAVERGNADIAKDLIQFLTNTSSSKVLTLANGTIPANTAALNDPEVQALEVVSGFGRAFQLGVPIPASPYADAQWEAIGEATYAIWTGDQTPEEALSTAQAAAENRIEEIRSGTVNAPTLP